MVTDALHVIAAKFKLLQASQHGPSSGIKKLGSTAAPPKFKWIPDSLCGCPIPLVQALQHKLTKESAAHATTKARIADLEAALQEAVAAYERLAEQLRARGRQQVGGAVCMPLGW